MDPLAALALADLEFDRRLQQVSDDDLSLPTPCEGWTVGDLVAHVIGGNHMAVALLAGAERDEALDAFRGEETGDDLLTSYRASFCAMGLAFAEPGAMDGVCHHPSGDISGAMLLAFRIADITLHAWDLARGIGAGDRLDPQLVTAVWEQMEPMAADLAATGFFGPGPSGTVGPEASPQERMLDLAGRRP